MRRTAAAVLLLGFSLFPWKAEAKTLCAAPWRRLDQNAREYARPLPLALTATAVLPPAILIPTGADHDLRVFSQTTLGGSYFPEPVSILAPYVLYPATWVFYGIAAGARYCDGQRWGAALLQGTTETLLVVGLLKVVTGRTWPSGGRDPRAIDRLQYPADSREFQPFQAGIAAFPSGHTAIFFAAAAAFRASADDLGWWRFSGYPFAAAVGFAMWWGDHHWASDVLSGALLGEAIGGAAGRSWSTAAMQQSSSDSKNVSWYAVPTNEGLFVSFQGTF